MAKIHVQQVVKVDYGYRQDTQGEKSSNEGGFVSVVLVAHKKHKRLWEKIKWSHEGFKVNTH